MQIRNLFATLASLIVLSGCGVEPEDLPWTPLSLEQPLGWSTGMKIGALNEDATACAAALATATRLETRPAAPDAGTSTCPLDGALAFERATLSYGGEFAATCGLVAAIYIWERETVAPAAAAHMGAEVARVNHRGTFACRNIYNRANARPSEHARANAIDVTGFELADGRRVSVLRDWGDDTDAGRFLAAVRDGSCDLFSGVLGPDYNQAHRDHFHLDRGAYRICS